MRCAQCAVRARSRARCSGPGDHACLCYCSDWLASLGYFLRWLDVLRGDVRALLPGVSALAAGSGTAGL